MATTEIGDNISAALQSLFDDESGVYVDWCDPEGDGEADDTLPDIGAYSGPLSDPFLRPANASPTPCQGSDTGISSDTGGAPPTDTAGSAPTDVSVQSWAYGSGCSARTAALIVPLVFLPLLATRRRFDESSR